MDVTPSSRIAFDVALPLAEAQVHIYRVSIDGGPPSQYTSNQLTFSFADGVTTVTAPIPAMTQGAHTLTVTRTTIVNSAWITSPPSNPILVNMVLVDAPANLRIA